MRIAFYAPLKSPDHPLPSGDRHMARGLLAALRRGGHEPEVVSTLRTFQPAPDMIGQAAASIAADEEIARLGAAWTRQSRDSRPMLWFTYHNYYKAPDLLGPRLSAECALPYVVAEASHAPKRDGLWGSWYTAAERAIRQADAHLVFTPRDKAGLSRLLGSTERLFDLPPFIDVEGLPHRRERQGGGPLRLATVAMMRHGDKAASYAFLTRALAALPRRDWHLTVIGDGPARGEVETALAWAGDQIAWTGMLSREAALAALAEADVYVWPGVGEAFGLAYLEAQAVGLPVVALDVAGVSSVVVHGRSGLLTPPGDVQAYADAVQALIDDRPHRLRLGAAARAMVRSERTLDSAAAILDAALAWALDHKAAVG